MERDALVIGAGVVGLTTAARLREDGWRVRIQAAEPPERTTSAVAAAIGYPYRVGPVDRVTTWSERSFDAFARLAWDAETGRLRSRSGYDGAPPRPAQRSGHCTGDGSASPLRPTTLPPTEKTA